jgi:hypothetical protein
MFLRENPKLMQQLEEQIRRQAAQAGQAPCGASLPWHRDRARGRSRVRSPRLHPRYRECARRRAVAPEAG